MAHLMSDKDPYGEVPTQRKIREIRRYEGLASVQESNMGIVQSTDWDIHKAP